MSGQVSAILGLGRSVGIDCARRLRAAGHRVLVADPDQAKLQRARDELNGHITTHLGDIHTKLGLKNVLSAAGEAYGDVDHLVVIPPITPAVGLNDADVEAIDQVWAKTARSAITALKLFAAAARDRETEPVPAIDRVKQRGTATFILSVSSLAADRGRFLEAVSQQAMLAVVRAASLELAAEGVRCNAIAAIRPRAEENEPWLAQRTPAGRAALGDEIAETLFFLTSPGTAIITGEVIVLDGGRSALNGVWDAV